MGFFDVDKTIENVDIKEHWGALFINAIENKSIENARQLLKDFLNERECQQINDFEKSGLELGLFKEERGILIINWDDDCAWLISHLNSFRSCKLSPIQSRAAELTCSFSKFYKIDELTLSFLTDIYT